MTQPQVTVLMPVHNREQYVAEAIESVLGQDFADFELLIVDDGSTDRTPDILRAWAQRDPRIVILTLPSNQGITRALNAGLRHARADCVARFDSDDLMMPHRLREQLAVLRAQPEVVLVSSVYEIMTADGKYGGTWREDHPHEIVVHLLNYCNIVGGHGQMMYRRADVLAAGGYDDSLPTSEDYELWMRLLRRGRIVTLPLIGMKQRDHGDRSLARQHQFKRHMWHRIMGNSLTHYLGRSIGEHELDALITVWRHKGEVGAAPAADRIMREAYARFRSDHADEELRRRLRERIARQWMDGARRHADAGRRMEAARYVLRAARWRWRYR